jgi:hypothetical protein
VYIIGQGIKGQQVFEKKYGSFFIRNLAGLALRSGHCFRRLCCMPLQSDPAIFRVSLGIRKAQTTESFGLQILPSKKNFRCRLVHFYTALTKPWKVKSLSGLYRVAETRNVPRTPISRNACFPRSIASDSLSAKT